MLQNAKVEKCVIEANRGKVEKDRKNAVKCHSRRKAVSSVHHTRHFAVPISLLPQTDYVREALSFASK